MAGGGRNGTGEAGTGGGGGAGGVVEAGGDEAGRAGRGDTGKGEAGKGHGRPNMGMAGTGGEAGGDVTGGEPPPPTRIQTENELPGSSGYDLEDPSLNHEIEAYTSAVSGSAGDKIEVRVHVSVAASVDWQLFRLGYYQGLGAREVAHGKGVHVEPQPDCPVSSDTGVVECQWATAFDVEIDEHWVSGYYMFKLTREDGFDTTAPLIVREAEHFAPVLVQASTNTWQAYNRWGGTSLYHDAQQVSYDRPYNLHAESGRGFKHEMYLMTWLEQHGIEVSYTTNVDVDRDPSELDDRKLFVVSGHDEYWSIDERATLDQARDNGLSLAILSANTGYWRVRLEPSSTGTDRRIVTCYKSSSTDPEKNRPDTTARFRDKPDGQPENELTGVLYQLGDYPTGVLPLYVADPEHWLFKGTGAKAGERVAVALGGEWDEPIDDSNEPSGVDVVMLSPAIDQVGRMTSAAATVYEPTAHSFVFSAGTEEFAHALAEPETVSPRAERMLDNVLARAGVRDPNPIPDLDPTLSTLVPGQVTVLAGTGKAGYRDGAADEAEFDSPSGLALGPDGTLYVTESRNHDVRAIAPDGSVTTLAGTGPHGSREGKYKNGTSDVAAFDAPNGIAVGADGTVFVADSGNDRVRAIAPDGTVSTYAGSSGGSVDGNGTDAEFTAPAAVAVGPDGSVFVVEPHTSSLRRIDPNRDVTTLSTDIVAPTAVAVAPDGTVYVASPLSGAILAWNGTELVTVANADGIAGERVSGDDVHSPLDAWLRPSAGLAVDGERLVFSDTGNDAVRELVFGSEPQASTLDTLVPETAPDDALENGQPAGLMLPRGLVRYGDGYAVADTGHHRIVVVKSAALAARK